MWHVRQWRPSPTLGLVVSAAFFALGVRESSLLGPWWLAASGIGWWVALRAVERRGVSNAHVVLGFVLLRAIAWVGAPATSGDVHRYAWEAEVWLAGANPWTSAPDAAELGALAAEHPELHARVEHRSIPAAYPPLAQALFVASTLAARGLAALELVPLDPARTLMLRALALAGDVAVFWALSRWLARNSRDPSALVAWAWCPLVALEFAGAGHFDSTAIAFAVLALTAPANVGARGRAWLLAAGAAIKFLPAVLAPFMAREFASVRDRRRALAWFAAASALFAAPLAWSWAGAPNASGLAVYAKSWESTSVLFRFLERPLWPVLPVGEVRFDAKLVARGIVLALWLALAVVLVRRRVDAREAAFALTCAFVLLSPTFHPWYATWIAPWIALRVRARDGFSNAFACLLAAAPLQYVVLARWRESGVWSEPVWLWPLMFGPFLFLLCRAALRARRP
jgi:hypothetical protein